MWELKSQSRISRPNRPPLFLCKKKLLPAVVVGDGKREDRQNSENDVEDRICAQGFLLIFIPIKKAMRPTASA